MTGAEIRALSRMLDQMDYYRLLKVEPTAPSAEVRRAYHAARRRFHPDCFLQEPDDVRDAVDAIARRITEGYMVLRDPKRRTAYDGQLGQDGETGVRFTAATAETAKASEKERGGKTPNGQRFFAMAEDEERKGNIPAAIGHMKMALTFEGQNKYFKMRLAQLEARRKA